MPNNEWNNLTAEGLESGEIYCKVEGKSRSSGFSRLCAHGNLDRETA